MAVDIGPKIGIDGEKEFRNELNNINQQIRTLGSEMKAVTSAFSENDQSQAKLSQQSQVLTRQIEAQEQKLQLLQKGLDAAAGKYGEADSKTLRWAQSVNDATADLNKMRQQLDKVEKGMDDVGDAADEMAKDVTDAGNESLSFVDALKASFGGNALTSGIQSLIGGVNDLIESTAEYRKIMGTLEVSSQNAGYTAEQTAQTYERLYGVLGDTQTAATTTANLQAIGLSQQELMTITDAAIGAWATYGDSIPIDSLSEAINETIQAGTVTGTFADVLNWAGTSEDDFNAKLAAANSTTERAQIVLDYLTQNGLADAGQGWRDLNADIVASNESQAKMDEAMGELGDRLSPMGEDLKNFATEGIGIVIEMLDAATEAWEKFAAFMDGLDLGIDWKNPGESMWNVPAPSAQSLIDGSHADGLERVPFDGYIAQLHAGERVLTAEDAAQLDRMAAMMERQQAMAATGAELRTALADAVNGVGMLQGGTYRIEIPVIIDGKEFYRYTIDDLRAVQRSNPEVGR